MLPLVALGVSMLPQLAGIIAGDRAGRVAASVVDVVQEVTGTSDPAEARAVLEADPGKVDALRVRLADIALERLRIERTTLLEEHRATLADIQSARARDLALAQMGQRRVMPAMLMVVATAGTTAGIAALVFGGMAEGSASQAAIIQVLTLFVGIYLSATAFEWGSSRGSRNKDDERRLEAGPGPFDPPKGGS